MIKAGLAAAPRALPTNELSRYFLTSLVALAIDFAIFSLCHRVVGLSWMLAAAVGFGVGAIIAYLLSIRFVFQKRVLGHSPFVEFLAFVVIGLAGLGVTEIALLIGIEQLHLLPEIGKLAAAAMTFAFNFVARKLLLFRRRHSLFNKVFR